MNDINCPYCDTEQEIDHDDGYGYEEDEVHEQECGNCEKVFHYRTHTSFSYDVEKAPCKNEEPHDWQPCRGFPSGYMKNRQRCSYCDEVELINDALKYNVEKDIWEVKD